MRRISPSGTVLALAVLLVSASVLTTVATPEAAAGAATTFERWRPRGIPHPALGLDPLRHRLIALGNAYDPTEPYELNLGQDGTWQRLGDIGTRPPGTQNRNLVYDPVGDRLIAQGGEQRIEGCLSLTEITDSTTWALSLSGPPVWTRLQDLPLSGAPLVADPSRQRMLLYGGYFVHVYTYDGIQNVLALTYSRDLWQLDVASGTWSKLDTNGPSNAYQVAALDPVRDRLIVMKSGKPRTAWAYSLSGTPGWTQLSPTGTEPAAAIDRAEYDPGSDALLLFSGSQVSQLTLGASPRWQAVATSGTGATVRGWDPVTRKAWGYDTGGAVYRLDAAGGWVWTQDAAAIGDDGRIPKRKDHAVTCDRTAHRTFVFGGTAYLCGAPNPLCGCSPQQYIRNDTWSVADPYDGGWQAQSLSAPLPALLAMGAYDMGLVHDPVRNRLILASGKIIPVSMSTPDVWTLDLNGPSTWTELAVSGSRSSRPSINASVYDAPADRALFFGGDAGNDLWAIDLSGTPTWQQVPIVGEPGTTLDFEPSAWDASRRRLWILDPATMQLAGIDVAGGASWVPVAVAGTPPAAGPRCLVTYDESRDRLLVVRDGGASFLWEIPLGSPEWREVEVVGGAPVVLDGASFTFDPFRDRALLFGGGQPSLGGETDELDVFQFGVDSATAVSASLASQDLTPSRVRLEWRVADAGVASFALSRSEDGASWTPLGVPMLPGGDRVVMLDESVRAGERYAYRLSIVEAGLPRTLDQVWVQVPAGYTTRLDGAWPNPARGTLRLSFALADGAPAALELLDVQGRSCARADVGGLGPGEHVLALSPERPLAPGLYFARLVTPHGVRLARLSVIR